MDKLRVLQVILSFQTGGAERLVIDLMENLDKSKFEVVAISLFPFSNKPFEKEIQEKGLSVVYLSCRKNDLKSYVKTVHELYKFIKSFKPHVVHSHLKTLPFLLLPYLVLRIPVKIHTIHNIAHKDATGLVKIVNKFCFRFAGVVAVSISKQVYESVKKVYGERIKSTFIYNGIDLNKFFVKTHPKNFANDKVVLVNVARFVPQKNHELLIRAFEIASNILREQGTLIELWLVGDGPLRTKIENLVVIKKLQGAVKFFGEQTDVVNILNHADIFILSSEYEGFGLVVAEALACGLPVIATNVDGISEILENGKFGVLVEPRNPVLLAQAIVDLVKNKEKRLYLSEIGRKLVENYFDIKITAKEYEKLYIELLRKKN